LKLHELFVDGETYVSMDRWTDIETGFIKSTLRSQLRAT